MTDNEVTILLWGMGAMLTIQIAFAGWISYTQAKISETMSSMDRRLTVLEIKQEQSQ